MHFTIINLILINNNKNMGIYKIFIFIFVTWEYSDITEIMIMYIFIKRFSFKYLNYWK